MAELAARRPRVVRAIAEVFFTVQIPLVVESHVYDDLQVKDLPRASTAVAEFRSA
jgi:hypothetical protein